MYELQDSYFVIIDTPTMVIGGIMIAVAVGGYFFFRSKRKNHNQ